MSNPFEDPKLLRRFATAYRKEVVETPNPVVAEANFFRVTAHLVATVLERAAEEIEQEGK